MINNISEAVEFLRGRLHEAFSYGMSLTAKPAEPIVATVAPVLSPEDVWAEYREKLLEGRDLGYNWDGSPNTNKRGTMATLIDNALDYHKLSPASQQSTYADYTRLKQIILPATRAIFPKLIANEIIGVQAMKGPVSQIHTLRVRYDPAPKLSGAVFDDTLLASLSFQEETAELEKKIRKLAAQLEKLVAEANSKLETLPGILEGKAGKRLSIQILKEVVEAKTRKLHARWTLETAQDQQTRQGQKALEAEIVAALAHEIVSEIDQELLTHLRSLPGEPTSIFDMANISGQPTFVGDVHAALAILINKQSNLIASRTRRGAGNWCVVSPTALTILQSATTSAFARTTEVFEAPNNTKFVGTLNNSMNVYVNQYANDSEHVLVGYKGNDMDAAAFYAPYNLLTSSGVAIDPQTFEPVASFMTRYGFHTLQNTQSSLGNAADYLGLVGINTQTLSFI